MTTFAVNLWLRPRPALLDLCGELDLAARSSLSAVAALIPPEAPVVLDLSGITFCDVVGYRALRAFIDKVWTVDVQSTPRCVRQIAAILSPSAAPGRS